MFRFCDLLTFKSPNVELIPTVRPAAILNEGARLKGSGMCFRYESDHQVSNMFLLPEILISLL